jgi:NAD(P)H-hydrate repair Nnr-like enzyme with NAD(P)H-hydrate epimerase domain
MVVQFIFAPLVQQYRKIYAPEILDDTTLMKKAGIEIKQAFSKTMPAEKAILAMVCSSLPAP